MTVRSYRPRLADDRHPQAERPRNRVHVMACRLHTCLSRRWRKNRETRPLEENFGGPSPQQAPKSLEDTPPPPFVPPLARLGEELREGLRGNATTQPRPSTGECVSLDTRHDRHPDPPSPCADRPVNPLPHELPLHRAAEAASTRVVIEVNCALDEQHPRMVAARIAGAIPLDVSISRPSSAFPAAAMPAESSAPLTREDALVTAPRDQCEGAHRHGLQTAASTSITADPGNLRPVNIHSMRQQPQQLPSLPPQRQKKQQPVMMEFTWTWAAFTGPIYAVGVLIAWMVGEDMACSVGAGMLWMVGLRAIWLIEGELSLEDQQWRLRYEQWRLSYEQWRLQHQQRQQHSS